MTTVTLSRPTVIGLVTLLVLRGFTALVAAGIGINQFNQMPDSFESWFMPFTYLQLPIGVLQMISAVLILIYKRIGLILGAVVVGLQLLLILVMMLAVQADPNVLGVLFSLGILVYIGRFLTTHPGKAFFV